MKSLKILFFSLLLILAASITVQAAVIVDDAGQRLELASPPSMVVSLLPSATEIICALGAGSALAGITYHDQHLPAEVTAAIVGGAFSPQFSIINDLRPDLLIVAPRDLETARAGRGPNAYPILVWDDRVSLADSEVRIKWLGQIFDKPAQAEEVIQNNRQMLDTIRRKVERIAPERRKRVMRLLYTPGGLLTPGRDYFQTELITAAGGLPPGFGDQSFVRVSLAEWREFKPEVVFACGRDQAELREYLEREGWRDAPAVKSGQIYNFPCALTCRAAANTGYFVAWLASIIYPQKFAEVNQLVFPQETISERPVELDIPYVAQARIVDSRLMDFIHRTLLIDFKNPQTIVSTAEGGREGILTVGNSFSPTPAWSIYHQLGFERSKNDLFETLKLNPNQAELMFTGADLNNLAVKTAAYKDMKVWALVTAGVEGNALRTSRDTGAWYEPGTINIIVLTNHHLSQQAATRTLLTITEAKTAVLWDMDVRSTQSPLVNPATGTGTDSVIVVAGEGANLTGSGGHTKMGQLIAEAVYAGVQEAISKQNKKRPVRSIFERLAERRMTPHDLTGGPDCPCQEDSSAFQSNLEALLLNPRYQGFLQAAFSLSDAQVRGQLTDTGVFEDWALAVAGEISGRTVEKIEKIISREDLPPILSLALNALGTGAKYQP